MIPLITLYAPIVFTLSYFFDVNQIGFALLCLASANIIFIKIIKSSPKNFFLPFVVFICSAGAVFSKNINALQLTPLLISIGFLLLFIFYSIKKKSIPLEATIKFSKKELTEFERAFLINSHNWWLLTLIINVALHIYFIVFGDMALWALYASLGWYILFAISIVSNIIIGKIVVQKNTL